MSDALLITVAGVGAEVMRTRSEEHTSELHHRL